jgi:hypothetical protein
MRSPVIFIIFLFCLLHTAALFAQRSPVAVFSDELEGKGSIISLIGQSENRIFTLSTVFKDYVIQCFEKSSLTPVYSSKISVPTLRDFGSLAIDHLAVIEGRPAVFYSGYSLDKRTFRLYIMRLDENGAPGEGKLIFTSRERPVVNKSDVMIKVSPDQGYFSVAKSFSDAIGDSLVYTYACISPEGKTLLQAEKTFKTKGTRSTWDLFNLSADAKGNLVAAFCNTRLDKNSKALASTLQIYRYDSSESFRERSATEAFNPGTMVGKGFVIDDGDRWILTGNYYASAKKKVKGLRGIYRYTIAKTSDKESLAMVPYSPEMRGKATRGSEGTTEIPPLYEPVAAFSDSLGSTWLVSERQSVNQLVSGLNEFYFGSVMITQMTPDGKAGYQVFVGKSQYYRQTGLPVAILPTPLFSLVFIVNIKRETRQYLSHASLMKNGELLIIFNDNPENRINTDRRANLTKPFESVPVVVTILPDGSHSYDMRSDIADGETIIQFRNALRASDFDGFYFLSGGKSSSEKIGKLRF